MQNSKNTLKSPRWCQSRLVESGFECGAAFLHSLDPHHQPGEPDRLGILRRHQVGRQGAACFVAELIIGPAEGRTRWLLGTIPWRPVDG